VRFALCLSAFPAPLQTSTPCFRKPTLYPSELRERTLRPIAFPIIQTETRHAKHESSSVPIQFRCSGGRAVAKAAMARRRLRPTVDLSHQQHPAVTGNIAARKAGMDSAAICDWKIKRGLCTNCHGETSLVDAFEQSRLWRVPRVSPLLLVQNPGWLHPRLRSGYAPPSVGDGQTQNPGSK
jgi:hypothetical protein